MAHNIWLTQESATSLAGAIVLIVTDNTGQGMVTLRVLALSSFDSMMFARYT